MLRTLVLRLMISMVLTLGILSPVRAGMIAHWNFDEGSGDTAYDSCATYNGTLQGATWASDRFGQSGRALQFGVNQWMDVTDSLKPSQVTVASWIYVDSFGTESGPIISSEKGFGADGFALRFGTTSDQHLMLEAIAPIGCSTSRMVTSSNSLIMGKWYHVAGTYDGNTVAIFIDGVLAGSNTFSTAQNLSTASDIPVGIGHLQGWGVQWFQGRMDDLRIYDYALSSGDIAAIVPEPSSWLLCAVGLFLLTAFRRLLY